MSRQYVGRDNDDNAVFLDTATGQYLYDNGSAAQWPPPDKPKAAPPVKTFNPGGDNTEFFQNTQLDVNSIIDNVSSSVYKELLLAGLQQGYSKETMDQIFSSGWTVTGALGVIDGTFQNAKRENERLGGILRGFGVEDTEAALGTNAQGLGTSYYTNTTEGFNELVGKVWDFYNKQVPFDLGGFGVQSRGGGGGGGGGARGLTPEEIRGQFDIDQLAETAKNIWRGMLLDDNFDARGAARSYVDAIVAGGAKQKIDFTEFIRNRAKATDRYASIYKNKPGSMSEEQYLTPYFQSALQVVRPGDADEIAIGGAQFGADSTTFAQRLRRTDSATGSAPYIEELQGRLSSLNRLFKG